MDFPMYDMQVMLSKPVVDWETEIAHQQGVHPIVVLNALLMYAMYEITTQDAQGMAKLQEFIHTLNAGTPVKEGNPW
jgi:hypothetical protein